MQYLNAEAVREKLGFKNVETVRRMVKRGDLVAFSIEGGRGYRFKPSDVENALKKISARNKQKKKPT